MATRVWHMVVDGFGTTATASNANDAEALLATVLACLQGANSGSSAGGYTNNGTATGSSPVHKIFNARFWSDGVLERDYLNPLQLSLPL